jgi:circadian clock protein KaiC
MEGAAAVNVAKAPTGITGLDEVLGGGLPVGRVTLVCGGPGAGKTLLATQFLVSGARELNEPGLFVSFEELPAELVTNSASLGWDLPELVADGRLALEEVRVQRAELAEGGSYDLEALFVRLGHAIDAVGARRVVLDTIETLFGAIPNEALLRGELRRLFSWLKERGVTTVVTAERGDRTLTRYGLEEYVSDCVILLDHRVRDEASTRRLRIVKYRGSAHGSDEYPFMIDVDGLSVFPLTSVALAHEASGERVETGVRRLDEMLGGGYYRASTALVAGGPGAGKTTLAGAFARACCERGERCLYIAMEESPSQVLRNMRSVGLDLEPLVNDGLLRFFTLRATQSGLDTHLAAIHRAVTAFAPAAVVLDPISAFGGQALEVEAAVTRLIDFFKGQGLTALLTVLSEPNEPGLRISSLIDTWLSVTNIELLGEHNRAISVLKSRGMAHSNQVREFVLRDDGIDIVDAFAGQEGVLLGTARLVAEARVRTTALEQQRGLEARGRRLEHRQAALRAQIAALEAELAADTAAEEVEDEEAESREAILLETARGRALSRGGAGPGAESP